MFKNRQEAGKYLAVELEHYKGQRPVVLAIPRGGVVPAFEIAGHLGGELSVVITRKLGFLKQPEAAFGAVAEDGSLWFNPDGRQRLSRQEIQVVLEREEKEIARRVAVYRNGEPLPSLKGRTVIIADDGIATGATLLAAVELCKRKHPDTLVVAAAVCGSKMFRTLLTKVDDVVILEVPEPFYAVSQVYEEFEGVSDEEVISYLERWKQMQATAGNR
jgi:putative phosphoribosyl transferase